MSGRGEIHSKAEEVRGYLPGKQFTHSYALILTVAL